MHEPTERTGAEADFRAARNRDVVARAFSAWADGSGSVFDILSDDVLWTIPGSALQNEMLRNEVGGINPTQLGPFSAVGDYRSAFRAFRQDLPQLRRCAAGYAV